MVPNAGREADAINFRTVKESQSVDIGAAKVQLGREPSTGEEVDPFEEFNSVTLHHDGEHEGGPVQQQRSAQSGQGQSGSARGKR